MDRYDDYYRSTPEVFGSEPNTILVEHAELIDLSTTALDIGCGQGRNTLFLARRKITVHALDSSIEAVRAVEVAAEFEGLPVRTIHGEFEDLNPDPDGYGAILVFGLIPDLRREQVPALTAAIEKALAPNGMLFITAFGTWDPSFERHQSEWKENTENSFCSLDGVVRTYLEPGELVALFPGLEVIHSWEGLGPEHRHGDGPPERHGLVEAVLRRS
jgi:cyclopropane fatty-acyl-phospholipid synthase-like methyltransferase